MVHSQWVKHLAIAFVIVIKIFVIARITKRTCAHYKSHKMKSMLNADLKKNVLSCFLKVDETVCARRSAGSAFQAAGPAYEKQRSPNFVRSLGVT
jgi:hypothetical protein